MKKMYKISLCGVISGRENFIIEGNDEEDALANLITYFVNNEDGEGIFWEELESLECEYSEEEIEDMEFVYIDATRNGANRPVYLIMEYRARIKRAYSPTEALKATLQANWPKVLLAIILATSLGGLLAK